MSIRRISTLLLLIVFLPAIGLTQKKKKNRDAAIPLKEFVSVCNLYKKTPLHLEMEYLQTASFNTSAGDSGSVKASFFLTDNGAYIRFGNAEQVVKDSLMLMVSLDQPVMMLFSNAGDIKARMNNYMGFQMADSALQQMEKNYDAYYMQGTDPSEKIIELKNKSTLAGTEITKETITVRYKTETKEPVEVVYIRRTLIPVSKTDLPSMAHLADKLITIRESNFLVNERKGVFAYKLIDHDPAMVLPVNLADRVRKNEDGKIVPVKKFEHYYLTTE